MLSYAEPVDVNHRLLCWAIDCESFWVMLSQWLWIMWCYAEPVVVKHCELCWTQCVGIMVYNAEPVGVNHCELCWDSGCESWCAMISKYVWIMVCYAEPVVGNHELNAVPVGVNHVVLCWASRCESRCAMLSQWLWIIVNYAGPMVVKHCELDRDIGCESLWVMLSQWLWIIVWYAERVCGNHGVLCWANGWESCCECCASGCESLCYGEPVVVNHAVLFCASRCEPWRVMRRQWLWIMLCWYVQVGVTHGELW
jgi:hypothetical protein